MKQTTKLIIVVLVVIFLAIIITCVQLALVVKKTEDSTLEEFTNVHPFRRGVHHVISLSNPDINTTWQLAERFPYVVAVTRNASNLWSFACFASVILRKWIVTAAHCRIPGHTHRVILFYDFAYNHTHAFPILFWRLHEKYNKTLLSPRYDIAVAKLNVDSYKFKLRSAVFDGSEATAVQSSVWKTVSTMDKQFYLTNQFEQYDFKVQNPMKCYESYGIALDDSLICVDASDFEEECFTHDFGPVYSGDKIVGLLVMKPTDCDMKLSIFTNVSYYSKWILRTTRDR